MSNSSRCPRILSGVNRTLIVLVVLLVIEFMVVRWYYTKPDQSRLREPIGISPYLYKHEHSNTGGFTPIIMGGIDYAVSQIKIRLADKEQSGFHTWPERPDQGSQTKQCLYYNDVAKAKRIVMRNVLKTPLPNQRDVSIVTHTSLDRLDRLKRLMDHWEGPVSVAVHVRPEEVPDLSYHLVTLAVNTTNLRRLSMHLVLDLASTDNFPTNYLRDVAFNASSTDRLFLVDVDFVTSTGLHKALRFCDLGDREAVVVPAFQIDQQRNRNLKIENAVELKSAWRRRIVQPFKSRAFPQGQRATRYSIWRVASKKYMVTYERLYEPYVLVQKREGIPHYDSRFMNADWDRSSHIYALNRAGYKFTVMPKFFVLYYPHPSVRDSYSSYKECSRAIWARISNTTARKSGYKHSALQWKGENSRDPHRLSNGHQIGQQKAQQGEMFGQRGEHFGQQSEQLEKGQKGKTNDISPGTTKRKPYFSDMERVRNKQNTTNINIDVNEKKPANSAMEKIQQNSRYDAMVSGEKRKPKFSEKNQGQIITTDVKSNDNERKTSYSDMGTQKKTKDPIKINERDRKPQLPGTRPFGMKPLRDDKKETKQGQLDTDEFEKTGRNTKMVGGLLEREVTHSEIGQSPKKSKQEGGSPFSRKKQDSDDNLKARGRETKPFGMKPFRDDVDKRKTDKKANMPRQVVIDEFEKTGRNTKMIGGLLEEHV